MSWFDWDSEENQDYGEAGTVTISTREYRDLIKESAFLRMKGKEEHSDWSKEYDARRKAESSLEKISAELNEIKTWFEEDKNAKGTFLTWKAEKMIKAEEED